MRYASYLRNQPDMISPTGMYALRSRGVRLRGLGDSPSGDPGTTMATTDTSASSLPSTSMPPSLQPLRSASPYSTLFWVLSAASTALGAYHGYRRNNSVGWAIWWGIMGSLFPVITPAIAFAQGFGRRAGRS